MEAFKTMGAVEDEFTTDILAKFHNDDIGKLCRSEPTIVLIGRRRFQRNRGKVDKLMEIKKSVIVLEVAIEQVTTAESSALKHAVKNGLYYLLKNTATTVMSSYLGE